MATPIRSRKNRPDVAPIDVTPAKLELGGVRNNREVLNPIKTPSMSVAYLIDIQRQVKPLLRHSLLSLLQSV